ncbi:MAG: hypothetical protein KKF42_08045, partial [Actinobacteria bacterium]|nr:hypothetical protein [Actinomycetota bacterium]
LDALRRRRGERDTHAQEGLPVAPFSETSKEERVGDAFLVTDIGSATHTPTPTPTTDGASHPRGESPTPTEKPKRGRGRAAIPSWDDILFGTRSDEDPA